MNKQELIDAIAKETGFTKIDTARTLDAMTDVICSALEKGDDVRLTNFGSWEVITRAPTTGRNPRTKEAITIPAMKQPKFRAGKGLKDAVNK